MLFMSVWLFWTLLVSCGINTLDAECDGKTIITSVLNGTLVVGQNPKYPENTHCEWLIKAPLPDQYVILKFKTFETECGYDFVKIYDGKRRSDKLLATLSGNTFPPVIVSNSSSVLLNFFSDNNYAAKGWTIDFAITNCKGNCSGHGTCVGKTCVCDDLYTGEVCDVEICPQLCNNHTSQGQCSWVNKKCICIHEYIGQSCSFTPQKSSDIGTWHVIKEKSSIFGARFGHAGVYVKENGYFWVFGGSDLNGFFDDLLMFDFLTNEWTPVISNGSRPSARFRHTLVLYKDTLILFGGEVANGTLLNDLWSFNMSTSEWRLLPGVHSPLGLASHTANVVGDELFIFAGRSNYESSISYEMYKYNLNLNDRWTKVVYKLSKNSDLRLTGHTSIYYPALESLVVFGGFKQTSGSVNVKRNLVHMYHVKHDVWMEVDALSENASNVPEPRAFHTAVTIGDYMVVYGGNVHKHYSHNEKCFGDKFYLFNLKTFTWVSTSLLRAFSSPSNTSWQPAGGRFLAASAVFHNDTLLLSGGYNGVANGDLLAFQFPVNIASGSPYNVSEATVHCARYNEQFCGVDPSCIWCPDGSCLSVLNKDDCPVNIVSSRPRLCGLFHQCSSCLTWGSSPALLCGWCVQDSRCYSQMSPDDACAPTTQANAHTLRGWWGDTGTFLKTITECRIQDLPPGLWSSVSFSKNHKFYPDTVSLTNPMRVHLNTKPQTIGISQPYKVILKLTGFLYPFLSLPIQPNVRLQLRITTGSASLRLGVDENPKETTKVISVSSDDITTDSDVASRTGSLFPNAAVNKPYYVEITASFVKDGYIFVFMNDELVNGSFVRPYFSSNCSIHGNCFNCLSDASCGWCSSTKTCLVRNSTSTCAHYSGELTHLVLNKTYCEDCSQHVECDECLNDKDCSWFAQNNYCNKHEYVPLASNQCLPSCYSSTDCNSCIFNPKCSWCGSTQRCIPWSTYLPDSLHGSCSHWTDWRTQRSSCSVCSQLTECSDCYKERFCGWCGEYHNGRCFAGGYEGPTEGTCDQLLPSNGTNSSTWHYTKCPDENECITKRDCHSNATCVNYEGGYECVCPDGFVGDGFHFCNVSCNPPCGYGECTSDLTCDCDLGWTGNLCSINCGCNNHSSCLSAIGTCDQCQENTHGEHCELCVRGSYGNATSSFGCQNCECNGHGDEQRGICDLVTGECYCLNDTKGKYCDQCSKPGLVGRPELGGGCYYPCKSHSVLSNLTDGAISSSNGVLPEIGADTNCAWIITTARNASPHIVYSNSASQGSITFQIKDIAVDCQTEHVYLYDGFPPYNLTTFNTDPSFHPIASLCGFNAANVPTIETQSGTLVVVFKGNASRSFISGFNATFVMSKCPDSCTGNRYCSINGAQEICVCKEGWTGPGCNQMFCPDNCSEASNQGYCDQDRMSCVCAHGFTGTSCSIAVPFGNSVWESISGGSNSRLPRMGHTMVPDNMVQSLVIYGGYSLQFGILGDMWVYNTAQRSFTSLVPSGVAPRYFHAAAVYQRYMFISGGITEEGFSNELWKFDLDTNQWSTAQNLPRRLAGHTLNVVGDKMYLIGGYNPSEDCSSKVYFLLLSSSPEWDDLKPTGDVFRPCFGHTSVYDQYSQSFIVFGKKAETLAATVAVLNLVEKEWTVISTLHTRTFHLSMMIGDMTMILGGYTDTTSQDFATDILVYNKECDQWTTIQPRGEVPRAMAHSSVALLGDEIYVFGGYNGVASDRLFRLNISSDGCSIFSTQSSCLNSRSCNWCVNPVLNLSFCYSEHTNLPVPCSNSTNVPRRDCDGMVSRKRRWSPSAYPEWSDDCDGVTSTCSACIRTLDHNDASASCFWSVDFHRCLSRFAQPMLCPFGLCGPLLRDNDTCPWSCSRTSYCSDCLEQYNCGWCTYPTGNGMGNCLEGTFTGPFNTSCDGENVETTNHLWISSVCLLENECTNGNHLCNENEICIDQKDKYLCVCKSGYEKSNVTTTCMPVCSQGCDHGKCTSPDVCTCSFGYVGVNCSIKCECYGKGSCPDEFHLDECTDCRDNTAGRSCERCLQFFVGDKGNCKSCYEKCNNNAKRCYTVDDYNIFKNSDSQPAQGLSGYGPMSDKDYTCECENKSIGKHCDSCESGHFKLKPNLRCEKCRCRGHDDSCVANTGLNCNCGNNTQTTTACSSIAAQGVGTCHTRQCSTCVVSDYVGDPEVEGQQCYRSMRILQHFSMARGDSSEPFKPTTNFFYVHPSYTNADIRLTLDVFSGSIDAYVARLPSAFLVSSNQTVRYSSGHLPQLSYYYDGLNKYSTFVGHHKAALITDVRHKLVVTFPYTEHQLHDERFYVVIKLSHFGADGIIYFKQDTSKIDLVVFFAVFFSCFFLFLSVMVIAWSIKHRINSRQQVHHREAQRERLESRPFAKFPFLFEYQAPSPSARPQRRTTNSSRKAIKAMSVQSTHDCLAAVSTVMIQLPQTEKTKMSLVLGTTLTLLTPQQLDILAKPEPKLTDEMETEM